MSNSRERLRIALASSRELDKMVCSLDENEVREALELEKSSRRRPAVLNRLVKRAVSLAETRTRKELVQEYTPWLDKNQSS
jgi:Holliday junction resolvasome RuvABC ATP-dependent DNA helicase subunit